AQAVVGYRRATALSPFDVDVVRHLGEALIKDNKPTEAILPLRTAAGQMPNDPTVRRALATALGMAGHSAEAATEMRRVVELAPTASAQGFTGRIDVTIEDSTGGRLPGVNVDLSGPVAQLQVSDMLGQAHFLNLPVGIYLVKVSLAGFNPYTNTSVQVSAGA